MADLVRTNTSMASPVSTSSRRVRASTLWCCETWIQRWRTEVVDVVALGVEMSAGSCRCFLAMARICLGMVAENSATCLYSGVPLRIRSTSSAKPMLSISSASSSTSTSSEDRSRLPRSRWSMTRPGVPTTMWAPRFRPDSCDVVALAAVDRQHPDAGHALGVGAHGLGHLQGELAGGGQHQRLDVRGVRVDALQHGQREGGGLAGAGLGQADDVAARQQRGDGLGLDRGGGLVPQPRQRRHDLVGQARDRRSRWKRSGLLHRSLVRSL